MFEGEAKNIIVVQFYHHDDPAIAREQENFRKTIKNDSVHLEFRNIFSDVWPWDAPEDFLKSSYGLILGGSTAFFDGDLRHVSEYRNDAKHAYERLKHLLDYVAYRDIPMLGICFGHQITAHHHRASVVRDRQQAKVGTHRVARAPHLDEDCIFMNVPHEFNAQYIHKDAVTTLPEGAHIVASGPHCSFAALRYGKNRYTFQFHPEFSKDTMERVMHARPEYIIDNRVDMSNVAESDHTAVLLNAFINKCVSRDAPLP